MANEASESIAVTPAMIEAGTEALGPFNRDLYEQTPPARMAAMITAIYLAMRRLEDRAAERI